MAPAKKTADPKHAAPGAGEAAEARRAHYAGTERANREIEALLVERRGYVQRLGGAEGDAAERLLDRVLQVDEQIELRGGTPPTDDGE